MQTVIDKLSDIFSAGFSAAGYDAALGRVVVSARPDLCQFQCNGAMSAAKQYRKALAKISDFAASGDNLPAIETREAAYMLSGIENLLERQLSALHKHVLEHNSELLDFKADDIFYRTKGCIYAVYYMLSALSKDHQDLIVETGQYENITAALSFLGEASALSPASVKNAAPGEVFAANHLLYLGYYLARAQNYIKTVHNSINTYARNQMQ